MSLKCAVIDDEPLALKQITSYAKRLDFLELTHVWSDPHEALEVLGNSERMLLFLDINMPDITGLELAERLAGRHYIIFTTAYQEYAIDGYRVNAVDYLLKPLSFDEFKRAAQKAMDFHSLKQGAVRSDELYSNDNIEPNSSAPSHDDYISVKSDYKVIPVKISDISFAESVGEYVRLNLCDGSSVTTLYRLKNMESLLPSSFCRVHRSYIVNILHVRDYTRSKITLDGDVTLPIGDSYRDTTLVKLEAFFR